MAAAGKWKLYDTAKEKIAKGIIDLDTHTFKMLLFQSTSNCDTLTHDELADLSNQVANAFGYTTDGQAITGVTVSNTAGVIAFDGDPVIWTASGGSITARHAVIIDDSVVGKPLVATCILDLAPADVIATDTNDFKITPHATGFFTFSGGNTN
jgi:hypothetical protein